MAALHLTNDNFKEEVLDSILPVLVDFSASWCGPCKMMAPVFDELADELQGKVKVAKLDVDECEITAAAYEIMSVPTIMLFKNGVEIKKIMGARPKRDILALID